MQILRNQALDLVGVVPAMENDWSVIPIDMKWEIFFDQSGENNLCPSPAVAEHFFICLRTRFQQGCICLQLIYNLKIKAYRVRSLKIASNMFA